MRLHTVVLVPSSGPEAPTHFTCIPPFFFILPFSLVLTDKTSPTDLRRSSGFHRRPFFLSLRFFSFVCHANIRRSTLRRSTFDIGEANPVTRFFLPPSFLKERDHSFQTLRNFNTRTESDLRLCAPPPPPPPPPPCRPQSTVFTQTEGKFHDIATPQSIFLRQSVIVFLSPPPPPLIVFSGQ